MSDSADKSTPWRFRFSLAMLLILSALISFVVAHYVAESQRRVEARAFANAIPDAESPIFACAQAESNEALTIFRSLPDYAFAKIDTPQTRIPQTGTPRSESYTLLIPSTEEVEQEDGAIKIVQRSKSSDRQRQSLAGSGPEEKLVTYHAHVGYTMQVLDDQNKPQSEMRFRDELRSRLIGKDEQLLIESLPINATVDPADLSFHRLDGSQLTTSSAMQRFQNRIPVVIVTGKLPTVSLYFRRLLHPDTIVIHDEQDQLTTKMSFMSASDGY